MSGKTRLVLETLQNRIQWLEGKVDPGRGPNSGMAREIRGLEHAVKKVLRYRDMHQFIYDKGLFEEFRAWLADRTDS